MGFSLKGLITGIATTAGDIMDEERKQTNALIAQRTKNSFENYNKYQETTEALRADIKKRDAQLLNFQPDLNEEERIAAAGVPNLVDMYQQMLAQGKQVTVRDMIKVSKNAAGMKFDNYVSEIGKIQPTQTAAAAPVSTKFFGPSADTQRKMGEKAAMATGIPESELRGFERMPATATVPSMGSINTEVFKKEPKKIGSVQEAMDLAAVDMFNIEKTEGKDNPKYTEAKRLFDLAKTYIDAPVETLNKRADGLRIKLLDEKDDAKKKQLSEDIARTEQSIKAHALATSTAKEPDNKETYNAINTSVNAYVNNRMREDEGASWRKYVEFKTTKMEDGTTFVSRTQKAEMPVEEQRKMFAAERALARQALITNGFASPTGVPLYNAVARIMNDRMISVGPTAPAETQPAPVAAPAATPATSRPAPKTQAEYNAIPPNTEYLDTDGKIKRKGAK
jgi:hypothetical protein